ncbi:hypothetical protein GCM10027404_33220 [Arthrobacter tumbae]
MYAYPSLLAASKGYSLNFRACSGATTSDVTATQLGALGSTTSYVTISVGGNDAGFVDVLTECAKPAWMSNCTTAIDRSVNIINNQLPSRLSSLYASIRTRAPQAKVVVAGYPRIFNGEDCNAATWFSPTEESRLNATADLLNTRTAAAAAAAGFTFRNPTQAFTGRAVCDDTEWINGLSRPVAESYHPNRAGHTHGYTPLLATSLTGSTVTVTTATLQEAAAKEQELTHQQRTYTAQDNTITPETFEVPDLTSPEAKKAASKAGVNLKDKASVDRADRRHETQQNRSRP